MTAPRRRWSFGFRTLFVAVTAVCCWLGYSINWIRQRHAVLDSPLNFSTIVIPTEPPSAPGLLWLFGEDGIANLPLMLRRADPEAKRIGKLFPESDLLFYIDDDKQASDEMPAAQLDRP